MRNNLPSRKRDLVQRRHHLLPLAVAELSICPAPARQNIATLRQDHGVLAATGYSGCLMPVKPIRKEKCFAMLPQ